MKIEINVNDVDIAKAKMEIKTSQNDVPTVNKTSKLTWRRRMKKKTIYHARMDMALTKSWLKEWQVIEIHFNFLFLLKLFFPCIFATSPVSVVTVCHILNFIKCLWQKHIHRERIDYIEKATRVSQCGK